MIGELEQAYERNIAFLRLNEYNGKQREALSKDIDAYVEKVGKMTHERDVIEQASRLIVAAGEQITSGSYSYLSRSINAVLKEMFIGCSRSVRVSERMSGKNPNLVITVVADGVERDIEDASGHGIAQVISLLSTICLIVLTGARRLLVIDEVLSGISAQNRHALSEALKAFAETGFQFVVCEHGFVPDGAKVYRIANNGGIGFVDEVYYAE